MNWGPFPERVSDHTPSNFAARPAIGPLAASDPLLYGDTDKCPACRQRFKEGEFVTLVALGPGVDPEEREKARAGRIYNAVAAVLHYGCATGEDPPCSSLDARGGDHEIQATPQSPAEEEKGHPPLKPPASPPAKPG